MAATQRTPQPIRFAAQRPVAPDFVGQSHSTSRSISAADRSCWKRLRHEASKRLPQAEKHFHLFSII